MSSNLDLTANLKLIDNMSAPLRSIIDRSKKLSQSFEHATRTVDAFNNSLGHVNSRGMSRINQPLQRTNSLLVAARQHAKGLASDFAFVLKSVVAVQRKADSLANSFAASRKQMRQQAANSALALGATAATAYQVIKPAIAFDKQVSAVQAVLELQKGSVELQKLRNQAITEGARSAYSAMEAAQAQYELGAAGLSVKQVYDSLPGTLDLAAAGQLDVARAAEIAGGVMNGFGLQADQMQRLGDVMVATSNKTAVGVEDIGEAMKVAAPMAKTYGATLEKTNAMIGILGNNQIKGSDAGTGIKAIMTRLATQPKMVQDALSKIKFDPVNKDGTMKDIGTVFDEIRIRTQDMGADEQIQIFAGLAGLDHSSKLSTLVASTGVLDDNTGKVVNKFKELEDSLANSNGLAKQVADIQLDNLYGDIDQLKGAWESLSIALGGEGGVLNSSLRGLAQNLTDVISRITTWVQANPELVKTIGALALKFIKINAAIWAVKYGALLMFGTFFSMMASFIKFGAAFMLFNAVASRFGFGFFSRLKLISKGVLLLGRVFAQTFLFLARNSIPFLITAIGQLGVALLTTPIGWAIMAIAVAALLIIKYWQPIKAFFAGMWAGFMQGIAPLLATLSALGPMLSQIFAPLRPVLDLIIAGISWLGSALMSLIAPFQATDAQLSTATSYGSQFGFVLGTIVGLIGQVVAGLVGALALGFQTIGTAIGTFAGMVVVYGGMAINYVASIPGRMMAFLAGLPAQMSAMGGQIMDGLKNGIVNKATAVVDSILSVANRIKSAFTGTKGMVIKSPSRVFMGYGDFMMQGLSGGILSNADRAIKATQWVGDKIKQHAPNSFGARMIDTVQSATSSIRDSGPIGFGTHSPLMGAGSGYSGGAQMSAANGNITININGAADPTAVANEVKRALADHQRSQQARHRRRLTD